MSGTYLRTYTGGKFHPLDPRAEDVRIEDIAHGLACAARFAGQTHEPYSVAQHSVMIAEALGRDGADSQTQVFGLLHDASEAYS